MDAKTKGTKRHRPIPQGSNFYSFVPTDEKKEKTEHQNTKLREIIREWIKNVNELENQLSNNAQTFLFQFLERFDCLQEIEKEARKNLHGIFDFRIAALQKRVLFNKELREHIFSYLEFDEKELMGWSCCRSFRLSYVRNEVFSFRKHRKMANTYPYRLAYPQWSVPFIFKKHFHTSDREVYCLLANRLEREGSRISSFCCNDLYLVFLYRTPMTLEKKKILVSLCKNNNLNLLDENKKCCLEPALSFSEWMLEIRPSFGNLKSMKRIDLMAVLGKHACQDEAAVVPTSNTVVHIGQGEHETVFVLMGGAKWMKGRFFGFSARTTALLFSLDTNFFELSSLSSEKKCCCGTETRLHKLHKRTKKEDATSFLVDFDMSVESGRELQLLMLMWPGTLYQLTFPSLRVRLVYCACAECDTTRPISSMDFFRPTKVSVARDGRSILLRNSTAGEGFEGIEGSGIEGDNLWFCVLMQAHNFDEEEEEKEKKCNMQKGLHGFYCQQLKLIVPPQKHFEKIQRVFWRDESLVVLAKRRFYLLDNRVLQTCFSRKAESQRKDLYQNVYHSFKHQPRNMVWFSFNERFSIQFRFKYPLQSSLILCFEEKTFLLNFPIFIKKEDFLESFCVCVTNHSLFVGWRHINDEQADESEFYFGVFELLKPLYLSCQKRIYECGKQRWWTKLKPFTYLEVDSLKSTIENKKEKDNSGEKESQTKQVDWISSNAKKIKVYLTQND